VSGEIGAMANRFGMVWNVFDRKIVVYWSRRANVPSPVRALGIAVEVSVVQFTLPHELSVLVLQNKQLLYRISAATMLELARDPRHLGADIGFLGMRC
jgi:hypothetical protein